ncbi:MAG: DNA-3-methyladenine glycosylase I [Clostridia bacterium]|nr:DNA-3-methyladenine glycosylase I [Clostridia bacterium]
MNECCAWSKGDPILEEYHDHEWCKINHADDFQFIILCLEGQAWVSPWRPSFRRIRKPGMGD